MTDNVSPEAIEPPTLEIGWIVAGKLDEVDRAATRHAIETVLSFFQQHFPNLQFEMPIIYRDEMVHDLRVEPVVLLDSAVVERNVKSWDYTLVVTNADLIGHYKSDALAVLSRTLESAVLSTARIDPKSFRGLLDQEIRQLRMSHRLHVLAIHCLGHMMGLDHHDDSTNAMYDYTSIHELDGQKTFDAPQIERVEKELLETADFRLEETRHRNTWQPVFYLQAIWLNRREIIDAIVDSRPWHFPFRLSRLTAAAMSAMLVLLVTAEVWELGTSQSLTSASLLSVAATIITTVYILVRQRLFVRRERSRLSEQNVVTNSATTSIVFAGMVTTYALLFVTTTLLGTVFFDTNLVEHWTNNDAPLANGHYLRLSAFIASMGIFIGSLGVSFEDHHYFRHITFVDEEV